MNGNSIVLDDAIKALPTFCDYIVPTAKKSGISPEAALFLLVLNEYSEYIDFYFSGKQNIAQELVSKGCINFENEKYILTSKGSIVAKSISIAKQKFVIWLYII